MLESLHKYVQHKRILALINRGLINFIALGVGTVVANKPEGPSEQRAVECTDPSTSLGGNAQIGRAQITIT